MANETDLQRATKLWRKITDENKCDVIIYAGSVTYRESEEFSRVVRNSERKKNGLLILSTFGGLADCAYKIARCMQECYRDGKVTIFVPTFCKSAGTLIAVGADELIMSNDAELGPLDVQRLHRDVEERTSGLTSTQALETLCGEVSSAFERIFIHVRRKTRMTSETAAHVSAEIVSGLYEPIFGKLDPMGLGENERMMTVASEYGERLSRGRNLITPKGISRLVRGYPSHGFVIDRTEADEIFTELRSPTEIEQEFATLLQPIIAKGLFDDEAPAIIEFLDFPAYFDTPVSDAEAPEEGGDDGDANSECDRDSLEGRAVEAEKPIERRKNSSIQAIDGDANSSEGE